ncbi:MAG TPA: hypothetical protein PKA27_05785, partial [Fimbriimonadaceae bacterium]|nr:hypothetical protein [Fimbriimonadaceae bacterium]
SCMAGQKSLKHPDLAKSAFTHAFLTALSDKRETTRVIDIVSEVAREMRSMNLGQTPYYYPGPPTGTATEIVLSQGNK